MPNYAPRVSLSYADISGVVEKWSQTCEKMVVYQHDADKEVPRIHVHMLLINCKHKSPEQLKRVFHEALETDRKGNDLWAWTHKDYPDPNESFIPYMTKGNVAPSFVKNFSPAELEDARSQWKDTESIPKGKCLLNDEGEVKDKPKKKTRREIVKIIDERFKKLLVEQNTPQMMFINKCEEITKITLEVLKEEEKIYRRSQVQEYRDTVLGWNDPGKFLNFCNEDIYRYLKYNG